MKLKFSRGVLFHIKASACLKYFLNECESKASEKADPGSLEKVDLKPKFTVVLNSGTFIFARN